MTGGASARLLSAFFRSGTLSQLENFDRLGDLLRLDRNGYSKFFASKPGLRSVRAQFHQIKHHGFECGPFRRRVLHRLHVAQKFD